MDGQLTSLIKPGIKNYVESKFEEKNVFLICKNLTSTIRKKNNTF